MNLKKLRYLEIKVFLNFKSLVTIRFYINLLQLQIIYDLQLQNNYFKLQKITEKTI